MQNTIAWVDKKREDGSILVVLEEMTGQDSLHVNERDAVEVRFQVAPVNDTINSTQYGPF